VAQGGEVTLTGPYLCLTSQLKRGTEHVAVVYALDGPESVKAALRKVMAAYPGHPLNVAEALKFQEALDRELLYYIEPNEVEKKTHQESEWWGWPAAVTGTLTEQDGQRWIVPTKIESRATLQPPEVMLRPDQPLAMPQGEPVVLQVTDRLAIKCLPIPAGSFLQGSPFHQWPRCHDEYPHECVLTKDFHIAETPVTQEVFEAVMGANPTPEARRGPQNPVENVLWADLVEFCRRVSEKTGRKVRLPTGAEFEYVARVGTSEACFPARYKDQESNIGNKTAAAVPVKTKRPNAWGCYDIYTYYGWHACSDYDDTNPTTKQVDPQGPVPGQDPVYNQNGHRALGGDQYGVRPNIHYWYFEGPKPEADEHWVGLFRVVVEAAPKPATGP
jgi:formylglycine-generating enzyme required for sulfatase activity